MLSTIITITYYLMSIFLAIICILNFIKTKDIQESMLYAIVIIPFLLRIFRIK